MPLRPLGPSWFSPNVASFRGSQPFRWFWAGEGILARIGLGAGVAVLSLAVAGCGLASLPATAPSPTSATAASTKAPAAAPKTEPTKVQASATAATVSVTAPAAKGGAAPASAKPLVLQLDAPAEDTIVSDPTLAVQGKTIPEAVVSVNGDLVKVGHDGSFTTQLRLEEGANDLEVVASDPAGNEKYVIRSVIYQP